MAPGDQFQRSISVPSLTNRPLLFRRSLSCLCNTDVTSNEDSVNIYSSNQINDLLINAAAQINHSIHLLVSSMQIQADKNDALVLLPELTYLVRSPTLTMYNMDNVLAILTKVQTFLQFSQYNKQSIFVTKCHNIVETVLQLLHQDINDLHAGQQPCASVDINSPEMAVAACIIIKSYLQSV